MIAGMSNFVSNRKGKQGSSSTEATASPAATQKTFEAHFTRQSGQPFGVMLREADKSAKMAGVQLAFVGPGLFQGAGLRVNDVITSIDGIPCNQGHEVASEQLSSLFGDVTLTAFRPPPPTSLTSKALSIFSKRESPAKAAAAAAAAGAEGAGALPEGMSQDEAAKVLQAHMRGYSARHGGAAASMPDAMPEEPNWLMRCLAPCLGAPQTSLPRQETFVAPKLDA